ncbi:Sugar efflux transporter C [Paraburkholderia nemoris]|uniref:MFS transporter n=1 Tax=Paraburkholderia nemoris TaxID=2793076 RepID=UPI00190A424B|nr:MFS transporter [Paraburkholderia nemoris]MBK3744575.1 MFS transporter [Paraburkholderia aspalathi]CAE6843676.1 Sugar efflux transporter C [Paraburkholderia nemoris]
MSDQRGSQTVTMSDRTGSQSALRQVAASKLFLGATIAMFLSGLGASAAAPQIVLFLAKELGASLPLAGFYYLTSLAAPVAGYFVGRYSDRTGNRLGLFRLCAVAGFVGWARLALSTSVWMPFIIAIALLAVSGATASQIFAAVHDELSDKPGDTNESVVAIIRMALTGGWIIGPVLGAWVAAAYGLRPMLWMTAICMLLQIAPLGTLNPTARIKPESPIEPAHHASLRAMLPLLTFTGLFVLVYAGEPVKYGFLLIYMEENLKLSPALRGAVIGIQPFIELLIMPFSIGMGRKLGNVWLMCIAAAMGVCANLCFALWPSAVGMFAGQILMGGVWGIFMVLGIIVAQRLLPNAVATASAIFMSSTALASALGGVAGGFGVAFLGLPNVFLLPALFAGMAVIGLALMARTERFRVY